MRNKTKTLIERFNTEGVPTKFWAERNPGKTYYPERCELSKELAGLLTREIRECLVADQTKLLTEYRRHFDWETNCLVCIEWEVCVPNGETTIECQSLDEVKEYLDGEKSVEEPDDWWDLVGQDPTIDGECGRTPCISISNLRLKEKDADGELVEMIAKAIASTGIDPECVPALMPRVYSEQWQLACAPSWQELVGEQ